MKYLNNISQKTIITQMDTIVIKQIPILSDYDDIENENTTTMTVDEIVVYASNHFTEIETTPEMSDI